MDLLLTFQIIRRTLLNHIIAFLVWYRNCMGRWPDVLIFTVSIRDVRALAKASRGKGCTCFVVGRDMFCCWRASHGDVRQALRGVFLYAVLVSRSAPGHRWEAGLGSGVRDRVDYGVDNGAIRYRGRRSGGGLMGEDNRSCELSNKCDEITHTHTQVSQLQCANSINSFFRWCQLSVIIQNF